MSLGEKLQQLRKEKSLSQELFAEVMDVSRQSVSKWELNQTYPEVEKLIEISEYFDVSMDYLVKEDAAVEKEKEITTQASIEISDTTIPDEVKSKWSDVEKVLMLAAAAMGMTVIRFLILGDYFAGIILAVLAILLALGLSLNKTWQIKRQAK